MATRDTILRIKAQAEANTKLVQDFLAESEAIGRQLPAHVVDRLKRSIAFDREGIAFADELLAYETTIS
jgi:hypothetical protein